MTMVASTIIPMAMAKPPSDIRFAPMPRIHIEMNAKKIEKGIDNATTMLARNPPMKISSTPATRSTPKTRESMTVLTHLETSVA
jgi:hypothetical protein